MKRKLFILFWISVLGIISCNNHKNSDLNPVVSSEFIFTSDDVPFPSCHASTIAETPEGMIAAWFGGTHEKSKDVGIWVSRKEYGKWTVPVEVANGVQNDTLRYPTWNPVLYMQGKKLILFYKVGPNCADWWGEMKTSNDFGNTWSSSVRLPENIWGPIKDKPVMLESGELLCPSSTENNGWQVHMEWTTDSGQTWERTPALNNGDSVSAIQPTILINPGNRIQLLCRTKSNRIYTAWSDDNGRNWSKLKPTNLPNNNSGIDAVTLHDGRFLLVYNHIDRSKEKNKRNKLNVAISDDGINWNAVCVLENDANTENEYSYPAVIQSKDGKVHITYTWKRKLIKHVVIDTARLEPGIPIVNGIWPDLPLQHTDD